jgi:hypothetical protein
LRVLGRVGRLSQLLASRRVRATFVRIAGHSATPCATRHSRKRQMVPVNKGRAAAQFKPHRRRFSEENSTRGRTTSPPRGAAEQPGFRSCAMADAGNKQHRNEVNANRGTRG